MSAEIIADCEHMYVQAMGQVAVARRNRIDDGDTERAEVRIARVAALRLQAEHTKHAAHALETIAHAQQVHASLAIIKALTELGEFVDMDYVSKLIRSMAPAAGLTIPQAGHGRSSRNV